MAYKDLEKKKKATRRAELNFLYKITPEYYDSMFEEQQGCCAICNKHQTEFKHRLCVDHCHTTGKVRGLLCYKCNTHLGVYEKYKSSFEIYLTR